MEQTLVSHACVLIKRGPWHTDLHTGRMPGEDGQRRVKHLQAQEHQGCWQPQSQGEDCSGAPTASAGPSPPSPWSSSFSPQLSGNTFLSKLPVAPAARETHPCPISLSENTGKPALSHASDLGGRPHPSGVSWDVEHPCLGSEAEAPSEAAAQVTPWQTHHGL